ncbi:MAG TPA: DUF805 domain-containing protein [Ideonella sp.]|nr:DUF805 domain-containing protein [Ideonella sp.]
MSPHPAALTPPPAPSAPAALEPLVVEQMLPWQIFLSPHGRISRRSFWLYGVLALLALAVVGIALLNIAGVRSDQAENFVNLLLAWPFIAISAKRWHDRDKSAWWVLVNLIPAIGSLWALIDNGFLRGTAGPNRFGEDPLRVREAGLL